MPLSMYNTRYSTLTACRAKTMSRYCVRPNQNWLRKSAEIR